MIVSSSAKIRPKKNIVCFRFPDRPCSKRADPKIFLPNIFWQTFHRLQNFFRIENRTISKRVMAILVRQCLKINENTLLSSGQGVYCPVNNDIKQKF